MNNLDKKVYKNALINERLFKFDKQERSLIINKLLIGKSESELSEELGIPKSTLHDWKTLRQDNKGETVHLSYALIIRKLKNITKPSKEDLEQIKEIKNICEEIINLFN